MIWDRGSGVPVRKQLLDFFPFATSQHMRFKKNLLFLRTPRLFRKLRIQMEFPSTHILQGVPFSELFRASRKVRINIHYPIEYPLPFKFFVLLYTFTNQVILLNQERGYVWAPGFSFMHRIIFCID